MWKQQYVLYQMHYLTAVTRTSRFPALSFSELRTGLNVKQRVQCQRQDLMPLVLFFFYV